MAQWTLGLGHDQAILFIPHDNNLEDYAIRLSETLGFLERIEGRDQARILEDIQSQAFDVTRIAIDGRDGTTGTIGLEAGATLVQSSRDLLVAGASSAIQAKPFHPTKKPTGAMQFARRARLGQTFAGSYGITIATSLPTTLSDFQGEASHTKPFERSVVELLAFSLKAIADRAASPMDEIEQDLRTLVAAGVSANLCDALTAMSSDGSSQVSFFFSPSPRVVVDSRMPRAIIFQPQDFGFVKRLSDALVETQPTPGYEVRGHVIRLFRVEGTETGQVTVLGMVLGGLHRVLMELDQDDYERAIRSHQSGIQILAEGTLRRDRRGYVLESVTQFESLETE